MTMILLSNGRFYCPTFCIYIVLDTWTILLSNLYLYRYWCMDDFTVQLSVFISFSWYIDDCTVQLSVFISFLIHGRFYCLTLCTCMYFIVFDIWTILLSNFLYFYHFWYIIMSKINVCVDFRAHACQPCLVYLHRHFPIPIHVCSIFEIQKSNCKVFGAQCWYKINLYVYNIYIKWFIYALRLISSSAG